MEKFYQNEIAHLVRRRAGAPGLLKITEWDKKNERGTVLLFAEIQASDRDNENIMKTLSDELTRQYFNALAESSEFAFEHALGRANIALKDILLAKSKSWLSKIHLIVLAIAGQEAHIGSVGNMRALLSHRDRIVDIIDGGHGASGARAGRGNAHRANRPVINPVKPFSHVVSGRITSEDSLILFNEAVLDYLSLERIRKTTQENHPAETAAKLIELLSLAPADKQFGLIVVKRTAKTEATPVYEKEKLSAESPSSVAEIKKQNRGSEQVLEQYLRPNEPQTIQPRRGRVKETTLGAAKIGKKLLEMSKRRGAWTLNGCLKMLSFLLSRLLSGLSRLPNIARWSVALAKIMLFDASGRKYYWLKAKNALAAAARDAKEYLRELPRKARTRWQNMAKKQKISLLAALFLVLLLAGSLAGRASRLARQKYQADYQNLLETINEKNDQAEAAFIYKDFASARQAGVQAINLIASLPQKTEEEKSRAQEMKNRAKALVDKLEKRQNLNALTPLITVVPPPAEQKASIVAVGKNIYYTDGAEGKIAELNVGRGLLMPLSLNLPKSDAQTLTLDDNHLLLFVAGKSILINVKDETSAVKTIALPSGIKAMAGYFRNIYGLVPSDGKIWRWKEQGGKYGPAQNWLREKYDLANTIDLAVDGSLYLLSARGEISVFANGRQTRRIALTLLEPLESRARLYTTIALKNLYIFDPGRQRILQLDKNGELRIQYQAAELKDSTAFTVDYMEENILFLAGDKIYRIPLTQ